MTDLQPPDETMKGPAYIALSQAMIAAHAEAKVTPGQWAKRDAGYLRSLAWKIDGDRHSVVMQGALTPSQMELGWFLMLLPDRLRPVEVRWKYEKHQLWFVLEPTPAPVIAAPRPDPKVQPPARMKV